jgi:hypothetical protein
MAEAHPPVAVASMAEAAVVASTAVEVVVVRAVEAVIGNR